MDMYEAFRSEIEKKGVDRAALGAAGPNPLPAGAEYTNPINPQPAKVAPTRVKGKEPGHWPTKAPAPVTSYSLPKTERPAAPAAPVKLKPMLKIKGASLEDLQLMFSAFMDEMGKTA